MAGKIEVAIADQNPVVRAGLETLVQRDGRFSVCGVYATGEALIEALKVKPVEIAIVGWTLPDMTGGNVLTRLKQEKWRTRVVIYTGERSSEVLRQAIKGGAWGFVSKTEEPQVLLEAVVSVARGRLSLPYVDIDLLNHDPLEGLTARERELLAALANGWTNLQIAARTGISRNTVKYHLKNLYDKLGVSNRAMAVALHVSVNRNDHH
ncbi:putative transcriptional regulatory protein sgaR [Hyphomicrobium sp. GJ21]|jgi:two-component system nitrate/nitrite response regulator NarP|uniref:response regulator transcription factor n=1 Tax=Hyphomicrobium sp. GJ21 TaxID=113574 RepID=UPI000622B580|nr:response regulator transcription factor [Hyphomicrobium sp. GJ21]MBN9352867.1 response regulator transcription factor [Hyphomicrobium denitrificans]CEJ83220.1 putative transcriptional regulatory protein sgaR [Hyphomicrobium sp. GJ21]